MPKKPKAEKPKNIKRKRIKHILDNPDFISDQLNILKRTYTFHDDNTIKSNEIKHSQLYKLFDEAIVNARDHVVGHCSGLVKINQIIPVVYVSRDDMITIQMMVMY